MKPARRLFEQFFEYYAAKNWADPVFLKDYYPDYPNKSLCYEYMQVFTPQRDPWNCTHNVNNSTLPVVIREFQRADSILKQSKTKSLLDVVYHLCDGDDFFLEFPLYIRFDCITWKGDDYFKGLTVKTLRMFCETLDLRLRRDRWELHDQVNNSLVFARLYPFSFMGKQYLRSSELETHSYWIGAHLSGPEMVILEPLQHFAAMMLKTKERHQYQIICPFLSVDLPNNVFPKPWRGFVAMRPKDWKQTEVHSKPSSDEPPSSDESPMPAPVLRRSPSPRPSSANKIQRHSNSFGHMPARETRRGSVQIKRSNHGKKAAGQKGNKNQHHQQPNQQTNQNSYLSITHHQRWRQRRMKRHSKTNQLTSRENQFQSNTQSFSGTSYQGNRKQQVSPTLRRNVRKISQQKAEKPLPVVVDNAHVSAHKYIHPNNVQSRPSSVVKNSLSSDTNAYAMISSSNSKNLNRNSHYINNPNPNRTPPRPGQKEKVVNDNPNQNHDIPRSTHSVLTKGLNREVDDEELSAQTDSDLAYPCKVVPNKMAMQSKMNRKFVCNNSRRKTSVRKTKKRVPEEKLIPRRRRNRRTVNSTSRTAELA